MVKEFDIQEYMTRGVERVVTDAVRATLKNPKESAYMANNNNIVLLLSMCRRFLSPASPVAVTCTVRAVIQDATARQRILSRWTSFPMRTG